MNNLSNSVYNYLVEHFEELPLDKQFHFAVRLHAWNGDPKASDLLIRLKPRLFPSSDTSETLQAIKNGTLIPLLPGHQAFLQLRQPYNERYPLLRSAARLLYWAAMLDYAYSTDFRKSVYAVIPQRELQTMYEKLSQDREAIAILSTHAVNFLFLYAKYCQEEATPDPHQLFAIGTDDTLYNPASPLHLQLRLYLLTHTLIAETMFYTTPLPAERRTIYTDVVKYVERLVAQHVDSLSLDTKLEFLVCCRVADYTSSYEADILQKAERSVSNDGAFLIDTPGRGNSAYDSFEKSEHRNMLYLMTQLPRKI